MIVASVCRAIEVDGEISDNGVVDIGLVKTEVLNRATYIVVVLSSVGKKVDRRGCLRAEDVVSIYKLLDEGCSVVEDERAGIAK